MRARWALRANLGHHAGPTIYWPLQSTGPCGTHVDMLYWPLPIWNCTTGPCLSELHYPSGIALLASAHLALHYWPLPIWNCTTHLELHY